MKQCNIQTATKNPEAVREEKSVYRLGDGSMICPDCWPRIFPGAEEPVYGWTDGQCDYCGTEHNEN